MFLHLSVYSHIGLPSHSAKGQEDLHLHPRNRWQTSLHRWQTPSPHGRQIPSPRYGQQANGTHPIEMHTYFQ